MFRLKHPTDIGPRSRTSRSGGVRAFNTARADGNVGVPGRVPVTPGAHPADVDSGDPGLDGKPGDGVPVQSRLDGAVGPQVVRQALKLALPARYWEEEYCRKPDVYRTA